MDRCDLLMAQVRQETDSNEYTSETGIQDSEIIRALSNAQDRIAALILNTYPKLYLVTKDIETVANQKLYDYPVDLFLDSRIETMWFSRDGNERYFFKIDKLESYERRFGQNGSPIGYTLQKKQFGLEPTPLSSGGLVRMLYQKAFAQLDKRRGSIGDVVLDTDALTITTISIDTESTYTEEMTYLQNKEYICICDKDGNIKMKSIPISEINQESGLITIDPSFVFDSDETIAVGDYVVGGKYSSTHSELSDNVERYFIEFAKWRVQRRDSSDDSRETNQELKDMEAEIISSYANANKDVTYVPVIDTDYLEFD